MKCQAAVKVRPRGSISNWVLLGLALISIAGYLLDGAFFYSGSGLIPYASKTRAYLGTRVIANAVVQYEMEYGHVPPAADGTKDHDMETDSSAAAKLIFMLIGKDKAANPNSQNFVGDINETTDSKDGMERTENSAALWDPWGHPYRVLMDTNEDGLLKDPETGIQVKLKVLVWSAGKDGDFNTWQDNLKSWPLR